MADNSFEKEIEKIFSRYKKNRLAYFHKISPPVHRIHGHIFIGASPFCDYIGVMDGRYIVIEAKECKKDKFPMANIRKNQVEHMLLTNEMGGLSFLLIKMSKYNKIFLIKITDEWHNRFWNQKKRPSMGVSELNEFGFEIKIGDILCKIED